MFDIDLIEIARKNKKRIRSICFVFTFLFTVFAFLSPNYYQAQLVMAPPDEQRQSSGGLDRQLGGLVSFTGISAATRNKLNMAIARMQSRTFIDGFIQKNNIAQVIYSDQWDSEKGVWKDEEDKKVRNEEAQKLYKEVLRKHQRAVGRLKRTTFLNQTVCWVPHHLLADQSIQCKVRFNPSCVTIH